MEHTNDREKGCTQRGAVRGKPRRRRAKTKESTSPLRTAIGLSSMKKLSAIQESLGARIGVKR